MAPCHPAQIPTIRPGLNRRAQARIGVSKLFGMLRRSEPPEVRKPMYWYRCCAKSDVEQVLESGQTFDLHWMVDANLPTPTPTERYLTLSAALVGPYHDPFLNISDGDVRTVAAPDITADTWEAQELVSSMFDGPTDGPAEWPVSAPFDMARCQTERNIRNEHGPDSSMGIVRPISSGQGSLGQITHEPSRTATPAINHGKWRHSAARGEFEPPILNGLLRSVNRKVQGSNPWSGANCMYD